MAKKHPPDIRNEVLAHIQKGITYRELCSTYKVSKSTISYWVKNEGVVHDKTRQHKHLKKAREKARVTIMNKRLERLDDALSSARDETEKIPLSDTAIAKSLLAMLYWAEGTKSDKCTGAIFVNTDPQLIEFYISLLRKCFVLDEAKFRIRVHIHHYHDPEKSLGFWEHITNVPRSQFGKIYVKKRSIQRKFRENFQGICSVQYMDAKIRRELLALGRLLAEKENTLSSFNG